MTMIRVMNSLIVLLFFLSSTLFGVLAHQTCHKKKTQFFIFIFIVFLDNPPLIAQQITGNLLFSTVDSLNQPITDVTVVVTGQHLQGKLGTTTNSRGRCELFGLTPGKVTIQLTHIAFNPMTIEHVLIQMGKSTSLGTIQLRSHIVGLPEQLIFGQQPVVDSRSTTYGTNLRSVDIQDLPIDRNYRNSVALVPQANSSFYGDEVNISGSTGNENKYSVDGVEVTDPFLGSSGTTLPYNFIQEIVVTPGGYGADTRSTLGGLINVITFSGTNEFHGSLFGFYTGNKFFGRKELGLLDVTQGDFSNYDVGFGLGGPIIHDQLWFFTAYNPTVSEKKVIVPEFGTYIDKFITHSFAAKLTWKPLQEIKFVLTATGDPSKLYAVGQNIPLKPKILKNPDPYLQNVTSGGVNLSVNSAWIPRSGFILETFIARVSTEAIGAPATERGANEVLFYDHTTGTMSGGIQSEWNAPRITYLTGIHGTILFGDQTMKIGMEYKDNSIDNQYSYHSIEKYGNTSYYESIGEGYGVVHSRIPSLYVQNAWQITDMLNIHGGVRWDRQYMIATNGVVAQHVAVPLQPRFGFVYVLNQDHSGKIFGSAGRYSQELALMLSADFNSDGGYNYYIQYNHDPRIFPTGGVKLYNNKHTIKPEIPGLRGQFFDEASLGYEQSIGMNIRLSVQGLIKRLGDAVDNVFLVAESRHQFGNLGSGILFDWPRATREYAAMIITIQRQEAEQLNFLASYVLSRDRGNYEGLFDAFNHVGFPHQNVTFDDLSTARINATGLVPNDRTHVFKLSGSYRFGFGITGGISFVAQSGTPLSEYARSYFGIRFLSPRGSNGRTPNIWDLNARFIYQLPYSLFAEARLFVDLFHIASQRKPVDVIQLHYNADPAGNVSAPNKNYGKVNRYQPPMSGRMGIEMSF